ncbi:hypothetical protein LIER_30126 [Lithospermum erythrorhizon]|uniref:Uncharacterized protein n=1 Tax=Lithospermum erythrorhizon TaxID=34254 RepID=A0AAV3RPN6_LITER
MEHIIQNRPGVSTRPQSSLARAPAIPNKEPMKTQRPPRMTPIQPGKAQSDGPRPSLGILNPGTDVRQEKGEAPTVWALARIYHINWRRLGKGNHNGHWLEWSISNDSHTREPSYRYDYDLTTSNSSPERSPLGENIPVTKER